MATNANITNTVASLSGEQLIKALQMAMAGDEILQHADIVRTGMKITVPEGMDLADAIKQLERQQKREQQEVAISEAIECSYWDGCHAMHLALTEIYGWVNAEPTWISPPQIISVEVGYKRTVGVPHGNFTVPNIDGVITTGHERTTEGRIRFVVRAKVKRKHEQKVRDIIALTRTYAETRSIYRAKAFRIEFSDSQGTQIPIPAPRFIDDRAKVAPAALILPKEVEGLVASNIFTPILHTAECRRYGIPLKRGVLLTGPFGTGKTLTANVAAGLAEKNGWTYIYCMKAPELAQCLQFAQMYPPAIVVCEDVDQVTAGERTMQLNEILNIIDGVDTKGVEVMTLLTTNFLQNINEAMLRPGRLDAVLQFTPPDAETAEKLIRHYGRGLIDDEEELDEVGQAMAGFIPAAIRECVERSKLGAIRLGFGDQLKLTAEALLESAIGMKRQIDLVRREPAEASPEERLGRAFGEVMSKAVSEA